MFDLSKKVKEVFAARGADIEIFTGHGLDPIMAMVLPDHDGKAVIAVNAFWVPILLKFIELGQGRIIDALIAHEKVHVSQFNSGQLKGQFNWDGRVVSRGKDSTVWKNESYKDSDPYEDREWEKEAFEAEEVVLGGRRMGYYLKRVEPFLNENELKAQRCLVIPDFIAAF